LAITSGTSVVAALQINTVLTTVLGAAAAISTAVQRFCAFAERAENARMTGKGYARIARNIESAILYVRSNAIIPEPLFYTKLVEEIKKDWDHVSEQAGEVPWELLKFIETLDTVSWVIPKILTKDAAPIRDDLFA
jgi:predicted RNA-binding protein with EMAP domain